MVMAQLYSDFIMYKTWASNSPCVYTWKLVFSSKYLSAMFLKEPYEEIRYKSNPIDSEANLHHHMQEANLAL